MNIDDDDQAVDPPVIGEIKMTISQLKNCKAARKHEIQDELLTGWFEINYSDSKRGVNLVCDVRRIKAGRRNFKFTVQQEIWRTEKRHYYHTVAHALLLCGRIDLFGIDRRSVEEAFVSLKRETAR